jgi:cellulose synthase (UDP-forming)
MEPAFPERAWPKVDVLLCHYSEPAEETMETLAKMLEMDYPPSKLHIYICDDGYFKSDFKEADEKPDIHWPTARANRGLIQQTGDVRQLTEDLMAEYAAPSEQDGVCRLASESVHAASTDGTGQRQVHQYKVTREKLPEPSNAERRVPRTDCAVGYVQETYAIPGLPRVSYVARVKPRTHHSKAGNINNVLYNVGSRGQYTAIFDNDMQPHPKFLTSTLPVFFDARPVEDDDDDECPYTDDPEANTVAFVQTPQYFKANWLMTERGDPLSHANTAFFDSGLQGMDGQDSTMFVGTNCIWRREALDSVSGIQYGTVSEDFWTGYVAQGKGWNSAYMRKDRQGPKEQRFRLSEGNVPENVAASMVQRKRWHKGSVELFLGAGATGAQDPEWTPPPARVPQRPVPGRVRRYRKTQYALLRLAWLNVFPPIFYTLLVIGGLWSNRLWLYLNPLGSYAIMIPFLLMASVVPSLGDITVPAEQMMSSLPEYFTYAPVRLIGTLEAFYSKVTGKAATWGNTGGTKAGSWNEFPTMFFVVAMSVGLVRSVVSFFVFDTISRFSDVLPIWAFACYMLQTYWKSARVSIQEFLEWGYDSLSGSLVAHWLLVPGIMAATVLIQWKEETDWSCI